MKIHSNLAPELYWRGLSKLGMIRKGAQGKMVLVGRWLANAMARAGVENAPIGLIWSSFAQETFERGLLGRKIVIRDSTHIEHQMQVLDRENQKYGISFEPDIPCIEREAIEYRLADRIIVLSHFAKKTFVDRGIDAAKISVLPLGVHQEHFYPAENPQVTLPLRAIYFGTVSLRKGVQYLLNATQHFSPRELKLTIVGPVEPDFKKVLNKYSHFEYHPPATHQRLGELARQNHLYIFPSLEDGFPNTLIQAMASGLVPVSTAECGPAEYIEHGKDGILIPKCSSEAIAETLRDFIREPELIVRMRRDLSQKIRHLTWDYYSEQMRAVCLGTESPSGGKAYGIR